MYHRKRKLGQSPLSLTQGRAHQNEAQLSSPKASVDEVMLSLDDTVLGCIDLAKAEKEYWDTQEKRKTNESRRRIVDGESFPVAFQDSLNSSRAVSSPLARSGEVLQKDTGLLSSVQSCLEKSSYSPDLFAASVNSPGFHSPVSISIEERMALEITNNDNSFWNEFLLSQNEMNLGCEPQLEESAKQDDCNEGDSEEKEPDLLLDYSVCVNVDRTVTETEINDTDNNKENHNDLNINHSTIVAYTSLLNELGLSKINWSTDDSVLGMKSVFLAPKPLNGETSICMDYNQQMKDRLLGNAKRPVSRKAIVNEEEVPANTENDKYFGLPEKVLKLVKSFKGIKDLYGEYLHFISWINQTIPLLS